MAINYINIPGSKNTGLLSIPGTYAIVSFNNSEKEIRIGKLGKFSFKKGYYIYSGSALGKGGVKSRINRHLKSNKSHRWHMDYLRKSVDIIEIWHHYGNERLECDWATAFNHIKSCEYPVKGFGSSDCRCYSHLIYSKKRPDINELEDIL